MKISGLEFQKFRHKFLHIGQEKLSNYLNVSLITIQRWEKLDFLSKSAINKIAETKVRIPVDEETGENKKTFRTK